MRIASADGKKERKKVPLKGNSVTVMALKDNGRNAYEFILTVGKTRLQFVAESQEDRSEWIEMFS